MDIIEEIKKLKSLLDEGAITQQEFSQLKQNLLVAEPDKNSANVKIAQPVLLHNNKSTLSKKLIILFVFILVSILGVIAVIHIEFIKDKISGILKNSDNKQTNQNQKRNDVVYEDGKELGVIVIKKFTNSQNNNGINLHVPNGKIWTPLYYEAKSNCPYNSIPMIFTDKESSTGWARSSSYYFYRKKDFISYRIALRNNKAISGDFAVMCEIRDCESETFLLYFLEE